MIGENALHQYGLDEVIYLPTGHSPHKGFSGEEMAAHRCRMVEAAIADNPNFRISYYEVNNAETSYTYRTLLHYREQEPDATLYFILGADSLFDFEHWRHPEIICKEAVLLAAVRDNLTETKLDEQIHELKERYSCRIFRLETPNFNVSGKRLRERVGAGKTIRYMLPDAVADYIRQHGLYREGMTFEEMKQRLESEMKPSRFRHTMGVVETAEHLAACHGADRMQTRIAALLHDCAKYMPDEERVAYCEAHGVEVNDAERENLTLLHAKCGAIRAKEEYLVSDPEIGHAIAVHTTGCPHMSLLDKIIYVADYIEPNRDAAPHLEQLRVMAESDLDQTIAWIAADTIRYLEESGRPIDDTTRQTWEYYSKKSDSESQKLS
jgi:nicotinate-nucleotide adenylyltransferase